MGGVSVDQRRSALSSDLVRTDRTSASRRPDEAAPTAVEAVSPLLRGWLHLVCVFLSLPAGLFVIANAGSSRARVAAIVYAAGVTALFGVSATYHRGRWSAATRPRMKRLDHATIFVMIAGSYTPLCLLTLRGGLGGGILVAVWSGALAGVVLALTGIAERRVVGLVVYIGLGWAITLALPALTRRLTTADLVLLLVGGLLYTVGSVVLATKRPDPVGVTAGTNGRRTCPP